MNKQDLLKSIADTAYNVGFGAKKHFATYDMVEKIPGFIGFISMSVGIFALYIDMLSTKTVSACLAVFGVIGMYVTVYNAEKKQYEEKGILLTQLFNELKALYLHVKASDGSNLTQDKEKLQNIEDRYYANTITKQIMFSDWYAHIKFFWQHQIDWIDEQKHFKLWRDKIPFSAYVAFGIIIITVIVYVIKKVVPCL